MPVPRVIYGLAKKRAQLAAEMAHPSGRIEYCRAGIITIDAALALWDEGKDAPVLVRRHIPKPALVPRLVLRIVDAMREAGEPMTTRQIVASVSSGLELDQQQRLALTRTVGWRLRDMRKEGRVTAIKDGWPNRWELVTD